MRRIQDIIIRPFDWYRDLSDVLNLRMTRAQEDNDFTSTPNHLLREFRRSKRVDSRIYVLCPKRQSGERLVGIFLVELLSPPDSRRCVLKGLLIDRSFQGRGVGGLLLNKLPELVLLEFPECRHLYLTVHKLNTEAVRLYEKSGFVRTGKEIPVGRMSRLDLEYVLPISPDPRSTTQNQNSY